MSGRRPLNLGTAPSQPPGEAGQIVRWIDRAFRALELASNEDLATFFDEFGHEGTLVETRTIDLNTPSAANVAAVVATLISDVKKRGSRRKREET